MIIFLKNTLKNRKLDLIYLSAKEEELCFSWKHAKGSSSLLYTLSSWLHLKRILSSQTQQILNSLLLKLPWVL